MQKMEWISTYSTYSVFSILSKVLLCYTLDYYSIVEHFRSRERICDQNNFGLEYCGSSFCYGNIIFSFWETRFIRKVKCIIHLPFNKKKQLIVFCYLTNQFSYIPKKDKLIKNYSAKKKTKKNKINENVCLNH